MACFSFVLFVLPIFDLILFAFPNLLIHFFNHVFLMVSVLHQIVTSLSPIQSFPSFPSLIPLILLTFAPTFVEFFGLFLQLLSPPLTQFP